MKVLPAIEDIENTQKGYGITITTKFSRDAKRHRLQRVVRTHARGTPCELKR